MDPWIKFDEGFGVLIAGRTCVEGAEDSSRFPGFEPVWYGVNSACGGGEDGCALVGFGDAGCAESVESALCEEESIQELV